VTPADGWRLQAKSNRQGSDGKLEVWPDGCPYGDITPGEYLTSQEAVFHEHARNLYQERLELGVAKEQARKDLPLSNYTEYYWKCDVGNILHYLGLRMDSHAQWEIRQYANAMGEFVKLLFPQTWQAFIDYRLEAMTLTRLDREVIKRLSKLAFNVWPQETFDSVTKDIIPNKRERQECWDKYLLLGLVEQK
jgi:thymidylate synthase (FAD)